jgi:YD repeat-containing protein
VSGVAYVVAYSYDTAGRMSGMTYPSGRTVTYGFDALGRVNQVNTTNPGESQVVLVQNVQYQPFGGVKSFTLGNGQIYSRSIDQDGRIASYTLGATNYALTFDDASRITGIGANTYGYDDLDRLTSAVLSSSNFGYSYDGVGNRLTKVTGSSTDTYAYSSTSNRISTLTPPTGPQRSFTLDANGSTTNDGVNTYAYDTRGRMTSASSSAGTASYQVNALGQRVKKSTSSGDTVFHYDSRGRLIAETDASGTLKRELFYLGDIPVAVFQ